MEQCWSGVKVGGGGVDDAECLPESAMGEQLQEAGGQVGGVEEGVPLAASGADPLCRFFQKRTWRWCPRYGRPGPLAGSDRDSGSGAA